MSRGFVILSAGQPWYKSGDINGLALDPAPVGKGKERKTPAKNRASAKGTNKVIHQIFASAAPLTSDPFWGSILRDLSMEKLPRGFRYVNGMLTFKVRTKTFERYINQTDPQLALNDTIDFMQSMGVLSVTDNEAKQLELKERAARKAEIEINSWSQIRTTHHRTILIDRYVQDVIKGLQGDNVPSDPKRAQKLESAIRLGLLSGQVNSATIHVENGRIVNIDGLIQNPEGGFGFDPGLTSVKPKRAKTSRTKKTSVDEETNTSTSDAASTPSAAEEGTDLSNTNPSFYKSWVGFLIRREKQSSRRGSLPIPIPSNSVPPSPSPPLAHSV